MDVAAAKIRSFAIRLATRRAFVAEAKVRKQGSVGSLSSTPRFDGMLQQITRCAIVMTASELPDRRRHSASPCYPRPVLTRARRSRLAMRQRRRRPGGVQQERALER